MSLYTNTGRLGNRPIKPGDEDRDIKDDDRTKDDIFTTIDAATGRGVEIGCIGYHQHNEDGTTYYMPCSSMEVYCTITGDCPEPVDPKAPLISEVDCEDSVMTTTTTTTTTTLRPSPFVDVISALSQEDEDPPGY